MSPTRLLVRAGAALATAFVVITAVAWGTLSLVRPQPPVNIHVRWTADVIDGERVQLESRFRLTAGRHAEGTTWAYELADTSTANIRAIVQARQVDDTEHLNRIRYRPVFADDRVRQNIVYAVAVGAVGSVVLLMLVGRTAGFRLPRAFAAPASSPVASSDAVFPGTRRFEWPTFGVSALLVVCALAALWGWVPPAYDTNDDAAIRAVLEGTLVPGQPPTGFALLPHAALGWLLVALRTAWPAAYAWDAAVTGTLSWGLAVFASLIWGSFASAGGSRPLAIAIAVIALLPLVGSVQYTISATVAGGAAVALAWSELQGNDPARRSVLIMAAVLLVAGLLLRSGAAMAGALAVTACLLPRVAQARRRGTAAMAALVAGSVVLFGLLHGADVTLYKMRPEWDGYRQVNYMVTALFDWNRQSGLPVDEDTGRSIGGWTTSDWDMLEHYWAVNPDVFGPARVAEVYGATAARAAPWDPLLAAARRFWSFDRRNFAERMEETWPTLLAALAVAGLYSRGRDLISALAATGLFFAYCLMIQAVFKDLPFRLFAPLASCFVIAVVLTTRDRPLDFARDRPLGGLTAAVVLGVVLLLAGYQTRTVVTAMAANHRHSPQVDAEGAALAALRPSLVVIHADTFPAEHWWRPFHRPGVPLPTIRLGRNNQNPQLRAFLDTTPRLRSGQAGRSTFPSAICDDPSLLVVSDPGSLEVLSTDLSSRSRRSITWDPVYVASFAAYRCVPAPAD